MKKLLSAVTTILLLTGVNVVKAQEELPKDIDIETMDCRTMLQMGGDDRESVIIFYHGYITAHNNATTINVLNLGQLTDQVINSCIDNPDETILNTFKQHSPGS
ncbi:MAG: hypothetical protein EA365_07100 [Gloeocapsa sp. DLM2.Bin57]|nr:MAG: hypothetical protein EA365_07100 [Gloeocapsa sp. DLM2.Bin57]